MGLGKWIGGIVGFMSMGPLGALAGYALGSLFDNATSKQDNQQDINDNQQAYDNAYIGQRNSFLFSLLVLASFISFSFSSAAFRMSSPNVATRSG